MKTYEVGYSYPSSTNAKRFGFYNTGCYTVAIIDGIKVPKYLAGYATKEEAQAHADTLGIPRKEYKFSM